MAVPEPAARTLPRPPAVAVAAAAVAPWEAQRPVLPGLHVEAVAVAAAALGVAALLALLGASAVDELGPWRASPCP